VGDRTDGGYLDAPVRIGAAGNNKLVMMSGERYTVIVDFAGFQAGVIGRTACRTRQVDAPQHREDAVPERRGR